jgi:hypothetical protein
MDAYRGGSVCTNNLLISRRALEEQMLAGLQSKVLNPEAVDYTFKRFEELARALTEPAKRGSGTPPPASRPGGTADPELHGSDRQHGPLKLPSCAVNRLRDSSARAGAKAQEFRTQHGAIANDGHQTIRETD